MPMASGLRRAVAIRPGEGRLVGLVAAVFASLEAGRGLGEVGANTIIGARIGAQIVPWLLLPLGVLSIVIALGYGGALGRVRRAPLLAAILLTAAALLLAEAALLSLSTAQAVAALAWLTVMATTTLGMTIAWTVATSSLDARQARRLFPLCTAAAIGGNLVGSLAAGPIARASSSEALFVAEAVLLGMAAVLIIRVAATSRARGWAAPVETGGSVIADVRAGADEVRHSPLLGLVAVAYVLLAILAFSVSYPFLRVTTETIPDDAERAAAFGAVQAIVAAVSFVVALALANRFYARLGIAAAALLLPLVYAAGFGLWVVSFSFSTAAAVTIAQQSTQRGLSNAAWSAFYNVIPTTRRAQAMAFIDGVPGQAGTILSGILLLVAGRFLAPEQVFWLGLGTAIVCIAVVVAIRRRYALALLQTLRSGLGERVLDGGPGLGDLVETPDVRAALIAALDAPEAGARGMAATLLSRSEAPEARAALADILDDPDPVVRGAAVRSILGGPGPASGGGDPLRDRAEACLAAMLDGEEAARVVGLGAVARLGRALPPERRAAALADPALTVRAMAVAGLATATDPDATTTLVGALEDRALLVRRAASTALATRPTVDPRQLAVLAGGTLDGQEAAIASLEGHGAEVRDLVLGWADRQVDRAIDLALAGHALTTGPVPAADPSGTPASHDSGPDDFLRDILAHRVTRHQDLALGAMAVLGAPAARGVIRRCLRSGDAEVRAQAIEALDSIGDRRLGAAIARLVELTPPPDPDVREATLGRLRDDVDPWIRALARRVAPHGDDMADVERTLGDIETMLQLRRVPLLAALAPEDLQRIAMVAAERVFAPGDPLVREGDLGDELFIILDGRVRVVHVDPDGSEHLLRTYDEGDHIGELAVLRERPRAATVIADGVTVRTLVIGGEGLTAILRERPDAAMAMLATLAERISAQR